MTTITVEPRKIRRYGWKPSLPGVLATAADTTSLKILDEVDPRPGMPAIFDQGELGSCTANAAARCMQYDAMLDGKLTATDYLARLWIYWQERSLEGSLSQGDTGAMGHDAFIAAAQVGVPAEKDWPYVISRFNPKTPPAKARKDAKAFYTLAKTVHVVPQNDTSVRQVLSNRQTIAFGFTVHESFEDESLWRDGKMPVPKRGEQVLGGHEILLCGYLRAQPDFYLCANSWGPDWMLGGYFLFPKAQLLKASVASDFRTIVRPLAA